MFSSAFVWPFPQRGGQIPSLGKLDAKMQILLHLKRFTKSRVCIRDTDSPSRDLEGMNKTAKRGPTQEKKERDPGKRKKRSKRKALDMTMTLMGRLLLELRSRLSNFYPVAISGSLKIVPPVLCFTSTYRQFHAVKVWGCKTVRYDATRWWWPWLSRWGSWNDEVQNDPDEDENNDED